MKLLLSLFFSALFATTNCGKEGDPSPGPSRALPGFKAADATAVFNSFNTVFYDPGRKLYYSTTDRNSLAAIWTQAIYWDIVMHAYERTGNAAYRKMIDDIYQGGYEEYDGYNWNNTVEWFIYDDMMWWVIALARAHQITGNPVYLEKSKSGFERVWNGYDSVYGGMFWQFIHTSKHACINYPTVIAAVRLYQITKDTSYLSKAKNVYAWSGEHLFNKSNGRVADHVNREGQHRGYEDYTYNQGTCIGAGVMLFKETGDSSYLADAILAAEYTKNVMSKGGLLPAEGDYNEQGVLKAIFAHYMFMLINEGEQKQYLPWIQHNATWAWRNRDKKRNIMYRNYGVPCPTGSIQSYEASSGVALLQLCPPVK